jgi:uncharacterized protein (TIGR03067 family)
VKRLILSIVAVLALATAVVGCGGSNTSSSGKTELEGTWVITYPDVNGSNTFTFSGNNWVMIQKWGSQGSLQRSGTFIIDTTANPKTIDMNVTASTEGSLVVGMTSLGIYKISGNTLTLELAESPDEPRPTEFTDDNRMDFVKQ